MDRRGLIDWDLWCIDGSSVRAARCAGGAQKRAGQRRGAGGPRRAARGAGGPRAGPLAGRVHRFGSKFHLLVDGNGLPMAVKVSPGQRHDSVLFEAVMDAARVPRPLGRPRTRPDHLGGDKGYSYGRIRKLAPRPPHRRRHPPAGRPARRRTRAAR